MHPDRRFAWTDREEILAFVADIAFCTIFVAGDDGPAVFHVPVIVMGPDRIHFHISRANRGAAMLEHGHVLLSCLGPDAYISPDWYGTSDQVPTWNYVAAEVEGPVRQLAEHELVALLDGLSAAHEARLRPKAPWTSAKMSPGRFEAMLKAIIGFELNIASVRGTKKLGQNKKPAEIEGALAGLEGAGVSETARLMRAFAAADAPRPEKE